MPHWWQSLGCFELMPASLCTVPESCNTWCRRLRVQRDHSRLWWQPVMPLWVQSLGWASRTWTASAPGWLMQRRCRSEAALRRLEPFWPTRGIPSRPRRACGGGLRSWRRRTAPARAWMPCFGMLSSTAHRWGRPQQAPALHPSLVGKASQLPRYLHMKYSH